VCSTANAELVKSLGAGKVIDYTKEDFKGIGDTYDIIFDTIGKSPFSWCVRSLRPKGIYLRAVNMEMSPILKGLWTSLTSSKKVIGGIATERKENLVFLKQLVESGDLKPVIDRCYPFEQMAEAHRYVDQGHKKGNVVITMRQ
jgi:NADPH:quinone reductase-like Zn-dependent oxidoreductase